MTAAGGRCEEAAADGPLAGLRVLELCDEKAALAGKLFADMGAEVLKIEPLDGDPTRHYAPFAGDDPDPERSLWFWYYNTSKRGITLNLDREAGRSIFLRLTATADFLLECGPPGRLTALGLGDEILRQRSPRLITVSITPFGSADPRSAAPVTDLTLLAGGGPVWMCGYDDHTLPPVRGGGNQGYHTSAHFAVMSALVALLHRDRTGRGQHIDVNMHAAANVTTEAGSYSWLVAQETVQRQTGRHASVRGSMPTQVRCADGRYAMTGIPPRTPEQFRIVRNWLRELGLLEHFPGTPVLELAMEGGPITTTALADDDLARAKSAAGREAITFLAEHMPAYAFFTASQERGFQAGIVNAPEEALDDPHFAARGFPVAVEHPELRRSFRYPGAPYRFTGTPWRIKRRAPLRGEDNAAVFDELGLSADEIAALAAEGTN